MKKTTGVTLWYFSVVALVLGLYFFAMCFIKYWHRDYLVPFAVFFLIFIVLYGTSYKPLKCENGHTLIQAVGYYRGCKRKGFKESYSDKDRRILISVAEDMEIMDGFDIADRVNFYNEGKQIVESMKNPFVRIFWELQDRFLKNKTEKERRKDK